jgi:major membrane immunogen (membrane-anchored lipoprotein)
MLKQYFTFALTSCLLLSACSTKDNTSTANNNTAPRSKTPVNAAGNLEKPYKSMPQMLRTASAELSARTLEENNWLSKINDPETGWQYFDDLFQQDTNLSAADKEFLSYTTLCTKDLVSAPNTDDAARRRHIEFLVNEHYKGYCLLYYAMRSLENNSVNQRFIGDMKTKIVADYNNDPSIRAMQNFDLAAVNKAEDARRIQSVKNNYGYIEQIRGL